MAANAMSKIASVGAGLRHGLKVLGALCLTGMMTITCADVICRYLGHPIFGSVEIVGYLATLTAAMALPYTHEMRGHIGVEILVTRFPKRAQAVIDLGTNSISLGFFAIVTWRMVLYANTMRESGEVSMNLEFPEYIIIALTAICFLVFTLTIIEDMAVKLKQASDNT
jgi:TRAP-type C4-dicarboxylate transport system permease small subunit